MPLAAGSEKQKPYALRIWFRFLRERNPLCHPNLSLDLLPAAETVGLWTQSVEYCGLVQSE